jgi:AraC-like DNA-binding protein
MNVSFPACGVWAAESRHGRGFKMAETVHDFMKVLHPIAGRGWIERGGARAPLETSDVVIVPAGCRHRLIDEQRRPLTLYVVAIRADVLAAMPGAAAESLRYRHCAQPAWSGDVRDAIRRLLYEQTLAGPGSAALSWGAAWTVLGRVWRMSQLREKKSAGGGLGETDLARARVAAYAAGLTEAFARPHSLDEAAAATGLGRRRFSELFRELTGDSWKQAVRGHQIAHAQRLLGGTQRSVLSIGYECGFAEVTAFYRAFRMGTGVTPAEWRKRGRVE